MAISPDGRYLAVTAASATTAASVTLILNLRALLAGRGGAVVGRLGDGGVGVIEATFSANGQFLFVSDEYSPALSVFNLARALRAGFSAPGVAVGKLPLGPAPVGSVLSPDGRLLYVTSELGGPLAGAPSGEGLLQVISVAKAERHPAASLLARAAAGCQPVRVTLSAHGSLAWVTARASNALLAFGTARLTRDPSRALEAVVPAGSEPVGVLLTCDGRYALTADSARFVAPGQAQTVSVVSTGAALAGRKALIGTIPAGAFPREFGYDAATRQVLLTNFGSGTVEEFPAPGMPSCGCR